MYDNGLTMYSSPQDFRPTDKITRGETAKFVSKYAEVIWLSKKNNSCEFIDIDWYDATLVPHIIESCMYGLLKWSNGSFKPSNTITEAEAMTLIIRSYEWMQDETTSPWYLNYFTKAKWLWFLNDADTLESVWSTAISRERLGTWFYALGWKLEQGIIQSKIEESTPLVVWQDAEEDNNIDIAADDTVVTSEQTESEDLTKKGTDLAITHIVPESEIVPYGVKELSFTVTIKNVGSHAVSPVAVSANMPTLEIQCQDTDNNSMSMIAWKWIGPITELLNLDAGDELEVLMKIHPWYMWLNEDPKPIFQTPWLKTVSCVLPTSIWSSPRDTYTYDVYPENNTKTFTFTIE